MSKLSAVLSLLVMCRVLTAQDPKPLPTPASPGRALQDAAQASAHDVPQEKPKGGASEIVIGAQGTVGSVEILTDGKGVNLGPYLQDALAGVLSNWYKRIPADARSKKGKLAIQFAIHKDGGMTNLHLVTASGDASLDRAALDAIRASSPFPGFPSTFTGPYIALRFRFYYNSNMADPGGAPSASTGPIVQP